MCDYAVGLSRQLSGSVLPSERPNHAMLEVWILESSWSSRCHSSIQFPMCGTWYACIARLWQLCCMEGRPNHLFSYNCNHKGICGCSPLFVEEQILERPLQKIQEFLSFLLQESQKVVKSTVMLIQDSESVRWNLVAIMLS
ncbi:hypothetical protein KP509_07G045300 [Ceratopteris richardii]|uniref:Uncharacterized protein n=1 Tax=Ceratopteris richardii TaxID=49495 RepID=A0A8T2UHV3_CERRI|nr:hypothetical protein KP509_07G045300 [Ceratopteris richardii]